LGLGIPVVGRGERRRGSRSMLLTDVALTTAVVAVSNMTD
jgi:hypothetical protein